ncbi:MAG: SDR family oxidoreductase [Verrucomicrobia bacterium]|nr:SDR family oxidoreductase [Verrucomicrobiota bacterium]
MKSIPLSLNEKVAVVTGGGSGIGEAMVKVFGRAGATVVIADLNETTGRRVEMECADEGTQAWFWATDVSKEAAVAALFDEVKKRSRRLDVLVNNAAWIHPQMYRPFLEQPLEEWNKTLSVNFHGAMLCCRAALPLLEKTKGNIVSVASALASVVTPNASAYCSSKAALQHLMKALALECAPKGVRVNCIAPGWIQTAGVAFSYEDKKATQKIIDKMIPMGRLGRPEEMAHAALFLASDLASYITGSVLLADGGWVLE